MRKGSLSRGDSGPPLQRTSRQCTRRDLHQSSGGSRENRSGCRPLPSLKDHQQELDSLRAELEAERLRSKEAQHRLAIEARELREAAKRDQQLLVDQLQSKWEQQRLCEIQQLREETKKQREAEIRQLLHWKEAELHEAQDFLRRERDAAMQQARDLQRQLAKELVSHGNSSQGGRGGGSGRGLSTECRAKLDEVLGKLRWDVDGDQATQIRQLEAQLELERRLFLKYILERFEGEPLLVGPLDRLRQASSPPKGKVNHWMAAGECAQGGLPQQGGLSGDCYSQLRKQNADLLNAQKALEERCTLLEEENALLRESSFPGAQDKIKILKRKSAELAVIAKRLEEAAEKLQEPNLRISNIPVPLALNWADRELCENKFAQQQGKDMNDQDSVLLAIDQHLEALEKECQKFQAKLSARQENNSLLKICNLDCLLRESQTELLRLRRRIALKSQRDSVQASSIAANGSSSSVLMQKVSSTIHPCSGDSALAENKPKTLKILKKDAESQTLPFGNEAMKNDKNITSKTESEYHVEHLEKQLVEERKQCVNLRHEVEENQKRCDEVTMKLHKILCENARLSEENSQLCGKYKLAEMAANQSADLEAKLVQVTDERNSAALLTKGLEIKIQNLEQVLKGMKEAAERQQPLESEPEKTLLELQKKEEMQQLQQVQTEIKRRHNEEVQFLETQGKKLEHLYPNQMEHVNLLNPEDTTGELDEWETDIISKRIQSENQNPFRLRVFLARSSYDPFSGPNQNPEAELPLTAGEYVYVCGEMDEDGFYVGELMDGRQGFLHSNLVEEVASNDLFSFIPSEPSDISYHSFHEPRFSCQSARGEEKSNSPDEEICASLLSDEPLGTLCEVQAAMPYPPNRTLLTLRSITATSAEITWFPSNRSYTHLVYLNEKKYDVTKAGIYCYTFQNLRPSSQYIVKVEPLVPQEALVHPQRGLEQKSTDMTFTTPSGGPPHAPIDVQVQAGSSANTLLIRWLPETIHPSGTSNEVQVSGYAIYISGQKVTEIMSPTAGSVSLDVSQINLLQGPQTVSVRTVTPFGESADSVPALISSNLWKVPSAVLSQFVASGQISKGFLESEGSPVPATEDTDKRRSEASLTLNRILKSKPDNKMTTEDASSESSLENFDANSMSPEPSFSSSEFELKDTDVGTSNVCFQDIFPEKDEGKQIKQLCKELSKLTLSQLEAQEDKTFRRGSWQFSLDDYRYHFVLSDKEEEEEEDQECQWCMADDVCRPLEEPESPTEVAKEKMLMMRADGTTITHSLSNSGPQRNFASGVSVSCGTPRLFVALFDYDPSTMSPNSDADEEELPFQEGQILKVMGDKDADGFYRGECEGKKGFIPSNMVSEIHIDDVSSHRDV